MENQDSFDPEQIRTTLTVAHEHALRRERLLADYVNGELPTGSAEAVRAHLFQCPECSAFCTKWSDLDRDLERHVRRPVLSPGFTSRVLARVAAEPPALSTAARARKAAELQAQAGLEWKEAKSRFFRFHLVRYLDLLGYMGLFAMAVGFGIVHSDVLTGPLVRSGSLSAANASMMAVAWISCGAGLVVALAFAARTRLRVLFG